MIFQAEKAQHNILKQSSIRKSKFVNFQKEKTKQNKSPPPKKKPFKNQNQRSKDNGGMLLYFCRKIIFKLGKNKNTLRYARFKEVYIP